MDTLNESKETGRLEAFSDGVFAVAITLLILDLQIPKQVLSDNALLSFLSGQGSVYLAFVTSFATIGVMWLNHHRLFTHITRSDSILMLLNLLLLLLIVFVPYPTALVAQYIFVPNHRYAALLFNGTYVLLAVCFNVLWRYATYKGRLLGKNADQHAIQAITKQYRFGPLFYLITFGLAWINVPASLVLNLLMAVFFALPGRKPRT
ncbi:MAG TPA: TMEM175 family protein [Streptosporangiaceae bacterium]|nr:TMEM175 family protein [Streptosporangiaceae bacterium]